MILCYVDVEYRWVDAYFPFTHPSWELEIWYGGEWMEVLGAGILEQSILTKCELFKHQQREPFQSTIFRTTLWDDITYAKDGDYFHKIGLGMEMLNNSCNISGGVKSKCGWAFGLGLERLAMKLYSIPDVRLFWSEDPGFLSQFAVADCHTPITYKVDMIFLWFYGYYVDKFADHWKPVIILSNLPI